MRTNKIEKKQRTVVALLRVQMKGTLNRLRYRSYPKHLYIYCRGKNIAKSFLANAESEGFTFGDGQPPTSKETTDIYALKDDFTISYTGWIVHAMFKNAGGNVVRIDYGKYISGASDWLF